MAYFSQWHKHTLNSSPYHLLDLRPPTPPSICFSQNLWILRANRKNKQLREKTSVRECDSYRFNGPTERLSKGVLHGLVPLCVLQLLMSGGARTPEPWCSEVSQPTIPDASGSACCLRRDPSRCPTGRPDDGSAQTESKLIYTNNTKSN